MIFHSIKWSKSISTNELCFIEEKNECTGKYDYQCLETLCSETKEACNKYLGISLFAKATFRLSMFYPNQVQKMNQINKSIRNCTVLIKKLTVNTNKQVNICIKHTEKCRQTDDSRVNLRTKWICKCHGQFAVECEGKFCALSSKHCLDFIEKVKANYEIKPLRPFNINTCHLKKE